MVRRKMLVCCMFLITTSAVVRSGKVTQEDILTIARKRAQTQTPK